MPHPYYYSHQPTHNPFKHPHILDVIMVCSNTRRYESRYRLFKEAAERMLANPNVRLTIVEMAYAERYHAIGDPSNPRNLLLRNPDELWHKENMINLGIARLPEDWKYVAWIDGDVEFVNKNWAIETVEMLQHYQVVQPWSTAHDLDPDGDTMASYSSFCKIYSSGEPMRVKFKDGGPYYASLSYPHSGYAWAARREAIDALGGLLDTAILGAGDHHMAWALLGKAHETIPPTVSAGYKKPIFEWEDRALKSIKKNIGVVQGTIYHYWHGKKKDRRYYSRWKILEKWQMDPGTDLMRDWQGLWRLRVENDRQIGLRDGLRGYMSARNEDSIDKED